MAEQVQVTKFKSLDGYVYDTEKQALAADDVWKKDNEINLEKEMKYHTYYGKRYLEREIKSFEKNPTTYNKLVVENTKHDTYYYLAKSPEDIGKICISIIKSNNSMNYYYTIKDKTLANEIVEKNDLYAAVSFIVARQNYQYENVEFCNPQSYD